MVFLFFSMILFGYPIFFVLLSNHNEATRNNLNLK